MIGMVGKKSNVTSSTTQSISRVLSYQMQKWKDKVQQHGLQAGGT